VSGTRLAPQPGPELTAVGIADRLYTLSGVFAQNRDTGVALTVQNVRDIMTTLDTTAAEATRLANEIGELTDMIYDLAEQPEPAPCPRKGPPVLTVIEGPGRC